MLKTVSVRCRPLAEDEHLQVAAFLHELSLMGCRLVASDKRANESMLVDRADVLPPEKEYLESELVVVFGGDGTIIKAAREFAPFGVPVLGVNMGHLGYLAELEVSETELVRRIVQGDFHTDDRIMLDVRIERPDETVRPARPVLNDAVLSNGPVPRILNFDLYCDGVLAQANRSDGMILATPTGSTAYSMSAGGPVADPALDIIISTPICPHSLQQRPVLYSGNSVLEFRSASCRENSVFLTLDGDETFHINECDRVIIEKSPVRAKLVRVKDQGFLDILRRKMSKYRASASKSN